jgi:hypothetical protein
LSAASVRSTKNEFTAWARSRHSPLRLLEVASPNVGSADQMRFRCGCTDYRYKAAVQHGEIKPEPQIFGHRGLVSGA